MKVEQIPRSDIWKNLQEGTVVWCVRFHENLTSKVIMLNDQSINTVNNLVSSTSEREVFFKKIEDDE